MEKDNKSLPMRVFSNTISSFPDTKSSKATTSLLQSSQHRHSIHPRLTDVQICSNEIIDLTSASTKEIIPVNLNAQARSYELTKINNNMSAYDVNGQSSSVVSSFVPEKCLDIFQGISKGE
jgi:hypothetical protein